MQDRMIEIETKIAYQEDTIEQLNEALIDQQKEITDLRKTVELLQKIIKSNANEGIKDISLETPPPHY